MIVEFHQIECITYYIYVAFVLLKPNLITLVAILYFIWENIGVSSSAVVSKPFYILNQAGHWLHLCVVNVLDVPDNHADPFENAQASPFLGWLLGWRWHNNYMPTYHLNNINPCYHEAKWVLINEKISRSMTVKSRYKLEAILLYFCMSI